MIKLANYSLAFLWISTAIISTVISPEVGFELLSQAGISDLWANLFVYGGSLINILLGIWILSNKAIKICCWLQTAVIVFYSILLTIIDVSFWVHPFGPLTKNIPILVLISIVYQNQKH